MESVHSILWEQCPKKGTTLGNWHIYVGYVTGKSIALFLTMILRDPCFSDVGARLRRITCLWSSLLWGQARPQTMPVFFPLCLIAHFWWLETWRNILLSLGLSFSIQKWNHWTKVIWHSLLGLKSSSFKITGGDDYIQMRQSFSDTLNIKWHTKYKE